MTTVTIEFDTDDDFLIDFGKGESTGDTLIYQSVEEAAAALRNAKITRSWDWNKTSPTAFTRSASENPTDHWYYEWISEAIEDLLVGRDYCMTGNQLLEVSIIPLVEEE